MVLLRQLLRYVKVVENCSLSATALAREASFTQNHWTRIQSLISTKDQHIYPVSRQCFSSAAAFQGARSFPQLFRESIRRLSTQAEFNVEKRLRRAALRRQRAGAPRSKSVQKASRGKDIRPSTLPQLTWQEDTRKEIANLVGHRALIVGRDIEWANIIAGFEQANKYTVKDERGEVAAFIAEETSGLGSMIGRQLLATRRNFVATVFDAHGNVMLRVRRPFHIINSQMFLEDAAGERLGEIVQRWHPWKRNYDLYLGQRQFASITGSFLAWEFELKDAEGGTLALIDRNFLGFGKEIFTDAGKYVIHFGMPPQTAAQEATASRQALVEAQSSKGETPPVTQLAKLRTDCSVIPTVSGNQLEVVRQLSLTERALALACAINIDFDYFSRHSGGAGILPFVGAYPTPVPIPVPSGGGSAPPDAGAPEPGTTGSGAPGGSGASEGEDLGGDEFDPEEESEGSLLGSVFDIFVGGDEFDE